MNFDHKLATTRRMSNRGASDKEACVPRCAYCLRDGKEMADPRQLPCSHAFCFNCLLEDIFSTQNTDVFTCPLCIKHHDLFSAGGVDSLPACSNVVMGEGLAREGGTEERCITCADQGIKRAAVSFCTKCENLFCVWHKRVHEEAHNFPSSIVKHELISVEVYCKSKAKFSSKYCPHHPENKLDGMCVNCNEFNCNTCRSFTDECQTGKRHKNKLLEELVGETATKLTIALEPALQLIKDQQELLIQSNRMTEQNGEELDHMLLSVDQVMENQLEEIRSNYSQLKTRINAVREENILRKKAYQDEAQEKIRMLQNLIDVKMSLETKHPADVILEGPVLCEKLTVSKNVELVSLDLAHVELRPAVDTIQCRLVSRKPSIRVTKKIAVKGAAYCVSHTADGQLVAGGHCGFNFLDESGEILPSAQAPGGHITGLSLYKGYVYVMHQAPGAGTERHVQKYSRQGKNMTSWKVEDFKFISQLAIVQDRLYTRSDGDNLLLAYSLTGKQQPEHNVPLPTVPVPSYLCAAPPDGLIVSDPLHNLVAKYSTSGHQVWIYKGLNAPAGACIDEYNRVWVGSWEGKIHILSPSGQFICELTHPDIKQLEHLSISGDQLACAAYTDGLLLYHVDYQTYC